MEMTMEQYTAHNDEAARLKSVSRFGILRALEMQAWQMDSQGETMPRNPDGSLKAEKTFTLTLFCSHCGDYQGFPVDRLEWHKYGATELNKPLQAAFDAGWNWSKATEREGGVMRCPGCYAVQIVLAAAGGDEAVIRIMLNGVDNKHFPQAEPPANHTDDQITEMQVHYEMTGEMPFRGVGRRQ